MEIRLSAEDLQKALQRVQGIVDRRATMPILVNVLLDASEQGLVLTATDLEIGARCEQEANVVSPGRAAIPARHLLDIIKNLPRGELTMKKLENDRVEITCGKARFKIVSAQADEFPALPDVSSISLVDLPAESLAEMIEKTQYAVSTDETRHNLNGVFVEQREGITRMVSTDGHRLAMIERNLEGDLSLEKGVILPRKGLSELRKVLADRPSAVSIGFSGTNAVFKTKGLVLVMRLIDGQFPDYEQVIPEKGKTKLLTERESLLETLRRVSLVSGDKAPSVRLKVESGVLTVYCENPDLGEASEDIEVDYEGEPIHVGFNARYLIDVLSVLGDEKVVLDISDHLSPGIIRSAEGEGYTAVVMPMRI